MKAILCMLALFALTATTADAYVRRTIGGGHVVRGAGPYGHPVARGAAVATGAAVAAGAATGWGWNQPYYGYGGGYANHSYGAYASYGGVNSNYMKALEESGYDPKSDYTAEGNMRSQ